MKLLINGACGRMGRAVLAMIDQGIQGAELAGAVDSYGSGDGILKSLHDFTGEADCIIDFSNHAATAELCDYIRKTKIPAVIATTGQTPEELAMIDEAAKAAPIFRSGNMSLGVALLMELARITAKMFPDADVEIVEAHHNQKLDVPSGTALMLAEAVKDAHPDYDVLVGRHENGKRPKKEIGVHSLRMGNTVGIHEVIVNTGTQIITLKHEAQDRSLFAEGALSAAAFLIGKQPGLYNMNDIVTQ